MQVSGIVFDVSGILTDSRSTGTSHTVELLTEWLCPVQDHSLGDFDGAYPLKSLHRYIFHLIQVTSENYINRWWGGGEYNVLR